MADDKLKLRARVTQATQIRLLRKALESLVSDVDAGTYESEYDGTNYTWCLGCNYDPHNNRNEHQRTCTYRKARNLLERLAALRTPQTEGRRARIDTGMGSTRLARGGIVKRRKPYLWDKEATAAAGFLDERSYIKRTKDGELRCYRFGEDMTRLRVQAFNRAGGAAEYYLVNGYREVVLHHDHAYCEMPIRGVTGVRCNRNISWETMELDHNPSLANDGDDSLEGVRAICRRCHICRHNRITKFRQKAVSA